jgi:hypothetical protein
MSHIPNSAMPQAGAATDQTEAGSEAGTIQAAGESATRMFGQIGDKVREYPKASAAAGVVAVGLAAAAIPAVRNRVKSTVTGQGKSGSGRSGKSGSKGTKSD